MVQRSNFQPATYLIANHRNGTHYCGVTPDRSDADQRLRDLDGLGLTALERPA